MVFRPTIRLIMLKYAPVALCAVITALGASGCEWHTYVRPTSIHGAAAVDSLGSVVTLRGEGASLRIKTIGIREMFSSRESPAVDLFCNVWISGNRKLKILPPEVHLIDSTGRRFEAKLREDGRTVIVNELVLDSAEIPHCTFMFENPDIGFVFPIRISLGRITDVATGGIIFEPLVTYIREKE